VVCCLLFVVCCLLFVVCCLLFVVCCLLLASGLVAVLFVVVCPVSTDPLTCHRPRMRATQYPRFRCTHCRGLLGAPPSRGMTVGCFRSLPRGLTRASPSPSGEGRQRAYARRCRGAVIGRYAALRRSSR